jgi:hypothetical protein
MIEILAVLSVSAAAGMRIALPLLVIGLLQADLWGKVPLLNAIQPSILIGILAAWSFLEIFIFKQLWGQRLLQAIELIFSPLVGAIMAMTMAQFFKLQPSQLVWIMGAVGGLLALVLQLVRLGWFYRLRGIPKWALLLEDLLCILLVIFAFRSPNSGGLIALILLWLAIRSSSSWYRWYWEGKVATK